MYSIVELAKSIAEKLGDLNATVSMKPDFETRKMTGVKVVVVPVEESSTMQSRLVLQKRFTLDIGIVCKAKHDDDLKKLIDMSEEIGNGFHYNSIDGCICNSVSWEPLYSVDELKEKGTFVSVIRVVFSRFENGYHA